MINITELRRLANDATPGPWVRQAFEGGSGSKYVTTVGLHPVLVADVSIRRNTEFIAAANPAAVIELLDKIEKDVKPIEQHNSNLIKAHIAWQAERTKLIAVLKAARDQAEHHNYDTDGDLIVALEDCADIGVGDD